MAAIQAGHGMDDWVFVRAACTGDHDALGALFDRHAALCFSLAHRLLGGNRERAEEVLLNVFTGITAAMSTAPHATPDIRLWLLSLVRKRCRELTTEVSRPLTMAESRSEPGQGRGMDGAGAIDAAAIRDALADLPDEERRIIELAYFDGRRCTEIADIMDLQPERVQSGMRQGLHTLGRDLTRQQDAAID